jgi:thiol-disulfide isomerase/thioredoxin
MTKHILIFILLLNCYNANSNQIVGKINSLSSDWSNMVYLHKIDNLNQLFSGSSDNIVDSCKISDNHFRFIIDNNSQIYKLSIPKVNQPAGSLIQNGINDNFVFLYPKNIPISVSFNINKINKSAIFADNNLNQKHLNQVWKLRDSSNKILQIISESIEQKTIKNIEIPKEIEKLNTVLEFENTKIEKYINTENKEALKIFAIGIYMYDNKIDRHLGFLNTINLKNLSSLKITQNYLFDLSFANKKLDFEIFSNTIQDANITINKKFVVIDFWASWCAPCRKDIREYWPNFVKQNNVIQLIGFNLDTDSNKARKAISADKNDFDQVFLNNNFENPVVKLCSIKNIPYYLLLDTKKKIVYKNLSTKDIAQLIIK